MSQRAIHQILVGAGPGDAITSMALTLRTALRGVGSSEIYAQHVSPEVAGEVRPLHEVGRPRRGDVLVYHASIGEPAVTRFLLGRDEPLVLIYHNITPSEFFVGHDVHFASNLHWGRHELTLLRERVRLAVAVSAYNARDLESIGYRAVEVIPVGLRPSRLAEIAPVGALAHRLNESFPNGFVLSVSQLLPHKRFQTILEAMHLVQWVHDRPLGLAIVGMPRMAKYDTALRLHARRLNVERLMMFGSATDRELATFYRMASIFVMASAHEGLALPPLEAMSFGVPVVARDAGALAETIGGAGIVLPCESGPMLMSEAIAELDSNRELAATARRLGLQRVRDVESEDPTGRFMSLVGAMN